MKILSLVSRQFLSVHPFEITRVMSTLPKVYVRHLDTEDKMKINFMYGTEGLSERNFGFIRSKDEALGVTISRIKIKINSMMLRKFTNKRKKKDTTETPPEDLFSATLSIFKGDETLDSDTKNIEAWSSSNRMKIDEVFYEILENPPAVLHLILPSNIMAGFPVYPKVLLEFCSKDECVFTWYKTLNKSQKQLAASTNAEIVTVKNENWMKLCSGFFYMTTDTDIGCRLRLTCIPKCGDKTGMVEETMCVNTVESGPTKCPFEDRLEYTKEITKTGRIRCVSYNILADLYADSDTARNDLFPYCPTEALTLDYRKQLYLKEIIGYNTDIICLQEVDRKVFHGDLIPILSSTGLHGLYNEKGGQVVEGLACFYRSTKFKVIETHGVILSDALKTEPILQPLFSKINENEKLTERFMNRTTALQTVLLESVDLPQKRILVGNTHLYFHPDSDNIRLMQGATCIMYLENLLLQYQKRDPSYSISLLLSGDFNSCPEFGVYELMTKGFVNGNCIDWKSNPEEEVEGMPFHHSLSLNSACGTPEYTNYTEGFVGCLDYIFFDQSKLKVCDIVPFPTHEQVIEFRALPNKVFPSDHIALVCTLEWKQ